MTVQIEFKTEGADGGVFLIRGLPEVGNEVLVAVEHLDDGRYLTMHGRLDTVASWHPCTRLGSGDGLARFAAGQALTAALRESAGANLRLHLRRRDFTAEAPLIILDAPPPGLTGGSGAHRKEDERPAAPAGRQVDGQRAPRAMPPVDQPHTPADAAARPGTLRQWAWLTVALACGGTLLWWYLGEEAVGPYPRSTKAGATGKALYLELKGQDLTPSALYGHAERIAQTGDCEAAIRLFVAAAKADPTLAVQLGLRYDPTDFQASPCFAEPKPDSAQVWYQQAAEAGIPEAQRRYGELLLAEARKEAGGQASTHRLAAGSSGPVYQDAIAWLRQASAAGDAAAADRLMALGER